MSDLPTNSAPEDLGRSTEVNRTMRRFGIHSLTKESHVLHFLPNETTGDANLFTTNNNNFLTIKDLFGDGGSKTAKHVVS